MKIRFFILTIGLFSFYANKSQKNLEVYDFEFISKANYSRIIYDALVGENEIHILEEWHDKGVHAGYPKHRQMCYNSNMEFEKSIDLDSLGGHHFFKSPVKFWNNKVLFFSTSSSDGQLSYSKKLIDTKTGVVDEQPLFCNTEEEHREFSVTLYKSENEEFLLIDVKRKVSENENFEFLGIDLYEHPYLELVNSSFETVWKINSNVLDEYRTYDIKVGNDGEVFVLGRGRRTEIGRLDKRGLKANSIDYGVENVDRFSVSMGISPTNDLILFAISNSTKGQLGSSVVLRIDKKTMKVVERGIKQFSMENYKLGLSNKEKSKLKKEDYVYFPLRGTIDFNSRGDIFFFGYFLESKFKNEVRYDVFKDIYVIKYSKELKFGYEVKIPRYQISYRSLGHAYNVKNNSVEVIFLDAINNQTIDMSVQKVEEAKIGKNSVIGVVHIDDAGVQTRETFYDYKKNGYSNFELRQIFNVKDKLVLIYKRQKRKDYTVILW